ncbi:hypothetical protein [Pollutimonas harenae]|uniref:Uncharacterized protein n=1 Tax=Pollutimonas harenae TaxID=657015 RepID=A0A853H1E7_9BURK|nr:hypothetical protein [Pollutimonas harenae]NYT85850.1 hypothetical protein [Pollutimonas harenae]TEA70907.1 hypothetical protein ERD84_09635 [Pollutimonas harenae]
MIFYNKHTACPAQQGQALVLATLLLGAALLVLIRYFAVGQMVGAKARQLHALDATAYSGALIQARAMNMLSYINRAHIGHQLAMAHLVTLGSWASLGGAQARQLASGNPPPHLISMLFGPEHGAAYRAASQASGFSGLAMPQADLARAYGGHDHAVRAVLNTAQDAIVATLPQAREQAMQAVLRTNYPEQAASIRFDLTLDHDNWPGYVQRQSGHGQLRNLVEDVALLYEFLSPRNDTAFNNWVVDARCPGMRHQLRRRGGTELDQQGRWQSADTLSFHALRSNRWIGCYFREYAMGWGWIPSAQTQTIGQPHVDDPPADFAAQDFWRWVQEATNWDITSDSANPLANSRAVASRQRWQGGGLPSYFDVASKAAITSLGFSVSLRHPGPDGLIVSTRSAAETFFDRPELRSDARIEQASLFNPYWQARLAIHKDATDSKMRQP